jgi:hypothetical protein
MTMDDTGFTIEDAIIINRNFEGREGKFNDEGDRNFCLVLPEEAVPALEEDGWNIRWTKPNDEGASVPFTSINIGYKFRPPHVVLISGDSSTLLDEDGIAMLDWADIISVDVGIRARPWTNNSGSGTKGWLKSLYVTIAYDPLRAKYGV